MFSGGVEVEDWLMEEQLMEDIVGVKLDIKIGIKIELHFSYT